MTFPDTCRERLAGAAAAPPHPRGRPVRTIKEIMHSMLFFRTAAGTEMADFGGFCAEEVAPQRKKCKI
ncbi:MAG: hypothetical protein F4160_18485 [Rhodospirillaceae bacterium]|nr:hypothetical protein [Rhodospirillaceae bacterium]MYH38779.1 hypothetical protein [Rhodospirillaceae bacterium]